MNSKPDAKRTLTPPDWIARPRVIYFYDTVCGWCNVARPEIDRFHQRTHNVVDFQVIHTRTHSWGYTPIIDEDRLGRIQKVDFELGKKLHGKTPSNAYLKLIAKKGYRIKSHLSALACTVINRMTPGLLFTYAHELQSAVYDRGKDPRFLGTVVEVAKDLGLDTDEFTEQIRDLRTHNETVSTALRANQLLEDLGMKGVPKLVYFGTVKVAILDPLAGKRSADHLLGIHSKSPI